MIRVKLLVIGAALGAVVTTPAWARGAEYDYAKVVSVTPVTRTVEVSSPQRECWDEEVPHRRRGGGDAGGMILGGVIGGVAGSRFGKGDGNKAATVVGTIAGAMVGRELSRRPDEVYYSSERRCRTVQVRDVEERLIGYDVRYRYHGRIYETRTDRDPGDRIRVRVSVTPVY